MHFSQAVATIQSLVGSVKGVQILYSDKDPLGVNLVINLTNDGIKLIFDPINQRLKTIEVHDLTLLKLKYRWVVVHMQIRILNCVIFMRKFLKKKPVRNNPDLFKQFHVTKNSWKIVYIQAT